MKTPDYPRLLPPPKRSFFLFGPRGTGKSTWLRRSFPGARHLDLLDSSLFLQLSRQPHDLEMLAGNLGRGGWIILDEVQKTPHLLDEVHRLMETRGWRFALCGSSARKLRRGGVNLLGGRAVTRAMEGLSAQELGKDFDLKFSLEWGMLPAIQTDRDGAADRLAAYVHTYLREEIREEGLIRRLPPFVRFLAIAGQFNGQILNSQGIARDAAIPRSTVDLYFSIMEDTLLGHFLPAWRPRAKVRETAHPKFYWFDPGVARAAAGWLHDPADRTWLGFALETFLFHELRVFNETQGRHRKISYYRTASGVEVDFVIETRAAGPGRRPRVILLEVKLAERWKPAWGSAMRSLRTEGVAQVDRMMGVYTGPRVLRENGVEVLPLGDFLSELHQGGVF